jgi:hypothetical protein
MIMTQAKTQSVTVSNNSPQVLLNRTKQINSLTTKQIKTIQVEPPVYQRTIKDQIHETVREATDTRRISGINPYYSYFPQFYMKELKNAFATYLSCLITFILLLGLLSWGLVEIIISANINN